MDTLIVEKKNDVYLTVDCDSNVQRELSEFFTFYVPGYKFMPAFRNRMWDGKIRLFNLRNNSIYVGLLPYIKEWLSLNGITYTIDDNLKHNPNNNHYEQFLLSFNERFPKKVIF